MKDLSLWPIGNCQVSALVDNEAGFVWGCAPQVDGDPLFCSLLEPKNAGGEWRVALENQVSCEQSYLRNSPILVTRLTDASGGSAEIFDFCPRFEHSGRMYRPVAFVRIVRPGPRVRRGYGWRSARPPTGARRLPSGRADQPYPLPSEAPAASAHHEGPVSHVLEGRPSGSRKPLHSSSGPDEPFSGNVGHTLARRCFTRPPIIGANGCGALPSRSNGRRW
jgi:hypothetical protein